MKTIIPGQTIGIIGGGQLGRMLAMSAKEMGYQIALLDPSKDCCARQFANFFIQADFSDKEKIEELCKFSDVVTFEFENIDSDVLQELQKYYHFVQDANVLKMTQHRLYEKEFAQKLGIPTVPYFYVGENIEDIPSFTGTKLMKTVRFGYDGKGQKKITSPQEVEPFTVVEDLVPLDKEISVVAVKGIDGIHVVAVVENEHRQNILYRSQVPTTATREQEEEAITYTKKILESMDYYGVLTVEYFISNGKVIFNEIAPRVHNSGHITMESATKSQFRAHIEGICGIPVGTIENRPATLYNILGQDVPYFVELYKREGGYLHLYEKEPRENRKVGHMNFLGHVYLERND